MNIKLEFQPNEISLEKIRLSKNNPRYTVLNSFTKDLKKLIVNEEFYDENKILLDLLFSEGDFSSLLSLLKSIHKIGFDNISDEIILIPKNNKYFIAEGNRRIMCLKLILDQLQLPENIADIDSSSQIIYYSDDENNKVIDPSIENEIKKKSSNYENCKKIIEEIQKNGPKNAPNKWFINCKVWNSEDESEIWRLIYEKHLNGEKPGMRKWSRGKYFADLLSVYKNGITSADETDLLRNLQRDIGIIKQDYKQALFILECFKAKFTYAIKNNKMTDYDLIENIKNAKNISALQTNHALEKIKGMIMENLNISHEIFKNEYLNINYNDEIKIKITSKKLEVEKFLSFIYDLWAEKKLTTRNIKASNLKEIELRLSLFLSEININNPINEDQLNCLNEFSFSIDDIINLIKNNKNINKKKMKRFYFAKEFKKNSNEFHKIYENNNSIKYLLEQTNTPVFVFQKLYNQLNYLVEKNYLNASAATIRSFIEQFVIWTSALSHLENKNDEDYRKLRNVLIRKNEMSTTFFRERNPSNWERTSARKKFELIFLDDLKNRKKEIEKHANFFNSRITKEWDEVNIILNEFIHASHRFYSLNSYNTYLKKLIDWQEIVLSLTKNIDFRKFNEINLELKKEIDEEWETKKTMKIIE